MNRRSAIIGGLVAIVVLGSAIYYMVFREPEAPSAPIEAIPLEDTEPTATESPTEEPPPTAVVEVAEEPTDEPEPTNEPEPTDEPEPTAEPETVDDPAGETSEASTIEGGTLYELDTTQSTARFELDEDLRGNRITVVGTSEQVAGQISFDPNDLAATQLGTILINARDFSTDSSFRNRAIHNRILFTEEYEFITFEPTEIAGLPDTVAVGDTVTFQVIGDLTIRDITQSVTFDVTVTYVSATQLEGSASTIVQLEDYELVIPSVPSVANVEEEVELYLDFIADN